MKDRPTGIGIINRKGVAIIISMVFATLLFLGALAYTNMLTRSKPQNIVLDERVKLDFLAQGMSELAILKFQLYPADFYAAASAATAFPAAINDFVNNDVSFRRLNFTEANSNYGFVKTLNVFVASMAVFTQNQYKEEALRVIVEANYQDLKGTVVTKNAVRIVKTTRELVKPF
ncbi:hypothetical protein HYY75_04285 [bacterium]|nr:hypothetical protein [bacterium]